jgi:hypothetical protein
MDNVVTESLLEIIPTDINPSLALFNEMWTQKVGSTLLKESSSRVVGGSVGGAAARAFAAYLERNSCVTPRDGWTFKVTHSKSQPPLILRGFTKAYNQLSSSVNMSSSKLLRAQRKVSIVGNDEWAFSILTQHADGFFDMLEGARSLAMSITTMNPQKESLVLKSFHILKQHSLSGVSTTTFGVHQDTEEDVGNTHEPRFATVVVRLSQEGITRMFVEGASTSFVYGSAVGDAGAFLSNHYHRSLPSTTEQTKIAFFFARHVTTAREKRRR